MCLSLGTPVCGGGEKTILSGEYNAVSLCLGDVALQCAEVVVWREIC